MVILIIHIIVSYDQNISLIIYVKDGSHVRLRQPSCVFHYRPETVRCSIKDAYTSEITLLALLPWILLLLPNLKHLRMHLWILNDSKKCYWYRSLKKYLNQFMKITFGPYWYFKWALTRNIFRFKWLEEKTSHQFFSVVLYFIFIFWKKKNTNQYSTYI